MLSDRIQAVRIMLPIKVALIRAMVIICKPLSLPFPYHHLLQKPPTIASLIFSAMKTTITLLLSLFLINAQAQSDSLVEKPVELVTQTGIIHGSLLTPKNFSTGAVMLIIAGSGPTDRDGNNLTMKNESLKQLAYGLANQGIASLRYDKRGIGESRMAMKSEATLRFDDYVADASMWISFLRNDGRFNKIIVAGHSEGSLIGMIAAQKLANGFVSIAGAGQSADKVLKEQLMMQPKQIKDPAYAIIDSLVMGKTVEQVNPMLFSLFRPSVQPYMISWFKYDPQKEIKKLNIPILILQGTRDLQVTEDDAKLLKKANGAAEMLIIKNMNHVLKTIDSDNKGINIASYSNPTLLIEQELVDAIAEFVKNVKVKAPAKK
jgi:uncharacterized protein